MLGMLLRKPSSISRKPTLSVYQRIIDHVFRPMVLGKLQMVLPDGQILEYGLGQGGVCAKIQIVNNDFFKKCVLFGDVGFGESYVDGDWQTDDIAKVIEWMITNVENHPTLMADRQKWSPVNFLKLANDLMRYLHKNSIQGSRQNIHAHYDLGNDFYSLWLDKSMAYSSAYFKNPAQPLEEAQYQKFEMLCQKLKLSADDHLLEIGSGWGGFAIYAAKNFGCQVTTVTISKEQYKYVEQRINAEGLEGQIDIQLKDYRLLKGKFDKVVSIEMLEAVGHHYYEAYFSQCHELLKPNGILAIQVIISPDHRYESFKNNIDWIQKHIFPGSLLPSTAVILKNINKTGYLNLHDFEDLTMHYVETLKQWHKNFNQKVNVLEEMGFEKAFIRKWNYYWCYCMAAFKTRNIAVTQMVFSRPNNPGL